MTLDEIENDFFNNAMNPDDTATENTMQENIQKYLAGEKIEKDFDPSIGCSIKWK